MALNQNSVRITDNFHRIVPLDEYDRLKVSSFCLVPKEYDYIFLGYTGENVTSVVYKDGGSGGTTVATLTLAYTGDNLTSVTRS